MTIMRFVPLAMVLGVLTTAPALAQVDRYDPPGDRPSNDWPYDTPHDRLYDHQRDEVYQGMRTGPVERHQGDVTFVTGGVTKDEAAAFRAAMSRYMLSLEFARANVPRGDFLAYVEVSIVDQRGRPVLEATSEGPFLLANLPAGQYTVRAGAQGRLKTQTVAVMPGQNRHLTFTW